MSANTFYYVYLTATAGGTLIAATTGHGRGVDGVEIMTGNPAATLVGAVGTNGSGQFVASNNFWGVISWFNQRPISMQPNAAAGTLASSVFDEINTDNRATFISWLGASVLCSMTGFASLDTNQAAAVLGAGFNSAATPLGQTAQANAPFAGAAVTLCTTFTPSIGTENAFNYLTPLGRVSTGSCSFNIINSVTIQG